jgi:hypothetical protein
MVAQRSFVIDATFLLDDAEKAFFGSAPLVGGHGRTTSVAYGAVRDMFRLRRTLGIIRGLVIVGADTHEVSSAPNLEIFMECLLGIGTNVLHEPSVRVGAICRSMLLDRKATWIVTRNKSLMQLVNARCGVILASEGESPEVITEDALAARHYIRPEQVPSFLALTDAGPRESLTTKQAARLLEVHGSLNAALDATSADAVSPRTRGYLSANKVMLLARLRDLTVIGSQRRAVDHSHGPHCEDGSGVPRRVQQLRVPLNCASSGISAKGHVIAHCARYQTCIRGCRRPSGPE